MSEIVKALGFIFIMWMIQGILSYFQIRHFRKRMADLKRKGRILIGRQKGRFVAGSIVILVIDNDKTVIDAEEMSGFTVFNKFKKKTEIIGKHIEDLEGLIANVKNKQSIKAIKKALEGVN